MGLDLAGSHAIVTGSSSGIGAALADALVGRGAVVLGLLARRHHELEAVADRCRGRGAEVHTWLADLDDVDAAEALAPQMWEALGHVDVWVHNAAMPMRRHVTAMTVEELQQTMRVNFEAPARMTMAVLDRFVARDRGQHVYVSSMGGRCGIPAETAYCASKAALCGWAEAMQIDLWDSGVDVRLVIPGPVDTDIWDRPGNDPAHYDGELTPPSEVAEGICSLIEGDTFEGYFPDLKGVATWKATDPDAYLAGAAAMASR
ncbi:MAG TPA: SDR family NAD(P)-dependent oxidoreductase [Acidimicrobiales bacterium]